MQPRAFICNCSKQYGKMQQMDNLYDPATIRQGYSLLANHATLGEF
jgi:hypothetical protein